MWDKGMLHSMHMIGPLTLRYTGNMLRKATEFNS